MAHLRKSSTFYVSLKHRGVNDNVHAERERESERERERERERELIDYFRDAENYSLAGTESYRLRACLSQESPSLILFKRARHIYSVRGHLLFQNVNLLLDSTRVCLFYGLSDTELYIKHYSRRIS